MDNRGYVLEIHLRHPISERDSRWMGVAFGDDLDELLAAKVPGCDTRVYDLTTGDVKYPAAK